MVPSKRRVSQNIFYQINWEEQFGRVIAEAQAIGTPVVGYDSGAIRWVVGDGGEVVGEGDLEELEIALNKVLHSFDNYKAYYDAALSNAKRFKLSAIQKCL